MTLFTPDGDQSDVTAPSSLQTVESVKAFESDGVDVSSLKPVDGLRADFLLRFGLLPSVNETGMATVFSVLPINYSALEALQQRLGAANVEIRSAPREWIESAIEVVYKNTASPWDVVGDDTDDGSVEDLAALKSLAEDAPVVKLVMSILLRAIEMNASDVHLETFQQLFRVRYRIDGMLKEEDSPPARLFLPVISHLKLRAHMNIAERRLPQDGRASLDVAGRRVDMRVSTVPTVYGESMVIRLLDQGPGLLKLESLGMAPEDLRLIQSAIAQPHGMILVTGPTGSGKTSTLYAALQRINNTQTKIITVEDPVEYQIDGVNQIQVKAQIGLTFPNALRSIVRQDPDVIMVGEIRDRETAEISIQSALTGHLVFSTLHANDSFGAPARLMEMGIENYLLASSLVLVLAQRLVRVICTHCKTEVEVTPADRIYLAEEDARFAKVQHLWHGVGCAHCANTGYSGRLGIYEVLPLTSAIKEAILKKLPADQLRAIAQSEGVKTMKTDGFNKALQGLTTIEEIARVTRLDQE